MELFSDSIKTLQMPIWTNRLGFKFYKWNLVFFNLVLIEKQIKKQNWINI